jgi:PEP-CTERM motif-containing protein
MKTLLCIPARHRWPTLTATLVLLAAAGPASALGPFSVNIAGTPTAHAIIFDGSHVSSDDHSTPFASGDLARTTLASGVVSAAARGHAFDGTSHLDLPQETDAFFDATATIGSLHASATADVNNGGFFSAGSGTSAVLNFLLLSWTDTVTFRTGNPAGSDFRLGLHLDDRIGISSSLLSPVSSSFLAGTAFAGVSSGPSGVAGPLLLSVSDVISRRASGDTVNRSPTDTVTTVMHMHNGDVLLLTGWLRMSVGASNAIGSVQVDAANTALFMLSTDDPLASYTTASDTVFATSVPEPAIVVLALAGFGVVGWRAHRRASA